MCFFSKLYLSSIQYPNLHRKKNHNFLSLLNFKHVLSLYLSISIDDICSFFSRVSRLIWCRLMFQFFFLLYFDGNEFSSHRLHANTRPTDERRRWWRRLREIFVFIFYSTAITLWASEKLNQTHTNTHTKQATTQRIQTSIQIHDTNVF